MTVWSPAGAVPPPAFTPPASPSSAYVPEGFIEMLGANRGFEAGDFSGFYRAGDLASHQTMGPLVGNTSDAFSRQIASVPVLGQPAKESSVGVEFSAVPGWYFIASVRIALEAAFAGTPVRLRARSGGQAGATLPGVSDVAPPVQPATWTRFFLTIPADAALMAFEVFCDNPAVGGFAAYTDDFSVMLAPADWTPPANPATPWSR